MLRLVFDIFLLRWATPGCFFYTKTLLVYLLNIRHHGFPPHPRVLLWNFRSKMWPTKQTLNVLCIEKNYPWKSSENITATTRGWWVLISEVKESVASGAVYYGTTSWFTRQVESFLLVLKANTDNPQCYEQKLAGNMSSKLTFGIPRRS